MLNFFKSKKWQTNRKNKIFLLMFGAYFCIIAILLGAIFLKTPQIKEEIKDELKIVYDIYPDTETAPNLTFFWGEEKSQSLKKEDILNILSFGGWVKGNPKIDQSAEPQTALEIHLRTKHNPIFSYSGGTLVWQNINSETGEAELVVRYGKNYAIKYQNIINIPSYLSLGDKITKGDLLGYTNTKDGYDILKFEVDKKISDTQARALYPVDFFEETSRNTFLELVNNNSKLIVDQDSKTEGWIAYVGKNEIWASMLRMGYRKNNLESAGEFSRANNLDWILNEEWQN